MKFEQQSSLVMFWEHELLQSLWKTVCHNLLMLNAYSKRNVCAGITKNMFKNVHGCINCQEQLETIHVSTNSGMDKCSYNGIFYSSDVNKLKPHIQHGLHTFTNKQTKNLQMSTCNNPICIKFKNSKTQPVITTEAGHVVTFMGQKEVIIERGILSLVSSGHCFLTCNCIRISLIITYQAKYLCVCAFLSVVIVHNF